jgi:uncharacterized membrane protein YqhA
MCFRLDIHADQAIYPEPEKKRPGGVSLRKFILRSVVWTVAPVCLNLTFLCVCLLIGNSVVQTCASKLQKLMALSYG